jgi:hypothetical protein
VAWSGSVAGVALAAAALIAALQKRPFADPLLIPVIVVGAVASLILIIAGVPDLASWIGGGLRLTAGPARRPPRLETGRWAYTPDGAAAPAATTALETVLPATGYMRQAEDRPPWVRYAILLACSPVSPDFDAREARSRFMAFLEEPPVASLISDLTSVPAGAAWRKRAAHATGTFDAVLTTGTDDDAVATARLQLPDGMGHHGRDPRCATFILHAEPRQDLSSPAPPADPSAWAERIDQVLQAPPALAAFLSGQLGLRVSGDPPAQAALRLETPGDIAQLIDATDLDSLPGGQHMRQAIGYFTASADGAPASQAATRMVRHVLQYGLKADA